MEAAATALMKKIIESLTPPDEGYRGISVDTVISYFKMNDNPANRSLIEQALLAADQGSSAAGAEVKYSSREELLKQMKKRKKKYA